MHDYSKFWNPQHNDLANAIVDNIKGNNTGNYNIDPKSGSVATAERYYTRGKAYPTYIYPVGKRYTDYSSIYYNKAFPVGTEQNDILFNSNLDDNPGKRNAILMAHGYKPVPLTSQEEVESRQRDMQVISALDPLSPYYLKTQQTINKLHSQATINWRNNFGEGKQGKFGGLTYNEALARQKEMQEAKAQGFNVDLGRWGADGKWGNQSQKEWERYQLWKTRQTPEFKFVKEGYDKGGWSDDELKNMEQEYAKFLDPNDRQRWQTLNSTAINALPAENRKDIYNPAIAVAPYAQVSPIVATKKIGGTINYQKIFK